MKTKNTSESRTCSGCKCAYAATPEFFPKDKTRALGIAYECKRCLSARKVGRDRRKERWGNMTDDQRRKASSRNSKYAKTDKGRAVFLRKAYERIDACDLSTKEVFEIICKPCVHCGTVLSPRGLDRIDNKLPHVRGNVAPSCAPCNFARGDRFTFEEMQILGKVIRGIIEGRASKVVENEARP